MKNVVHITTVHKANDIRIFFKECNALKEAGYSVSLIAPAERDELIDGVKIIALKITASRLKRMTYLLWQAYKKAIKENATLYHFHDPELIPVGLLLRLQGKRVIYDVHEDVPNDILLKTWIPKIFRKMVSAAFSNFEHFSAKFFNGIVAVTPTIAKKFSHPNVIEVRNYPQLTAFNNKNPIETAKHLFYAGLITENRGTFEMLKVAELSNTPLYLAGTIVSNRLQQKISHSPLVNYLGYLSQKELHEIYADSLVGLALLHPGPTYNESLPIKMFEYMAAGIPIIASNFSLWREIIEKHKCGFCVDPFNIDEIIERIAQLKNNSELALQMGARGRQAVTKYFSWTTEAKKLATLYHQLLS